MTIELIRELNGLWSVLVGIGALIAFGTWIKTSLLNLEKRIVLVEKQLDAIVQQDQALRVEIAGKLSRIETMLSTRPCVLGRDTKRSDDCD